MAHGTYCIINEIVHGCNSGNWLNRDNKIDI